MGFSLERLGELGYKHKKSIILDHYILILRTEGVRKALCFNGRPEACFNI